MSRLIAVRRLAFAALATTAIALACRASPGEAPPLAPRPERTEPSTNPVPGAPDPTDPAIPGPSAPTDDAGVPISVIAPPIYKAQAVDGGPDQAPEDALDPGQPPEDAFDLPPVPDAELPADGGSEPFR